MKSVSIDANLVEYIVAEVLRRLREQGVAIASNEAGENNRLVIEDHVVSLAALRGKLDGVRQVVVASRAIVTPSVKDELKEKGVQLFRR